MIQEGSVKIDDWILRSFGSCAELVRDSVSPENAKGLPYIGLEHIEEGTLRLSGYGVGEDVTSLKTRFRKGDILFGKLRPYFRKVIVAPFDGICSTDIWVVRHKPGIDTRFLYYWMASPQFVDDNSRASQGTKMPRAKWDFAEQLERYIPQSIGQRAIGEALGELDDKIELNRKICKTLEKMTQAIFKSWFMDFDPVHAKEDGRKPEGMDDETAALFPSTFETVNSQEVPKGWTLEEIRDRTSNIQYGLTRSASWEENGPKFLRITDIQGGRVSWNSVPYVSLSQEELAQYRLIDGDIVVARTGASTGENLYLTEPTHSVFASYLVRFQFNEPEIGRLVGCFMRSPRYFEYIAGSIGGSAQPNANAQTLAMIKCIFPTRPIAKKFFGIIRPMDVFRANLEREVESLTNLREALVPKLFSGDIQLSNEGSEPEATS